ncbi:hypothetical protein LZL87_014008 [Fusarium oxysporum]|nr:hypothetical protein LZL87_014008 [Fusarium oxysporum]
MDLLTNGGWVQPLLFAIASDYVWPYGLLIKILLFPIFLPLAMKSIGRNYFLKVTAGFIDVLYITPDPEYGASVLRGCIYVGTLLARKLVVLLWQFTRQIDSNIYNNLLAVVTLSLVVGTSWRYAPAPLKRVTNVLWEAVTLWSLLGLTATLYFVFAAITSIWQYTLAAVASANEVIWIWAVPYLAKYADLPQLAAFTYSSPASSFDPSTEIRLLKLHRKFPFLQLSAELISYPLLSAPPYHAISYVWSHGPQDMRSMMLNGKLFRVRGNVHDILVNCSSFSGPQLVWIDTICINQDNIAEKNLQVRVMQSIYARAAHVLICLGGTSSHFAHSLVTELQAVRNMWGKDYLVGHVAGFGTRLRTDPYLRARVKGLVDLMRHPWFSRVWVVQEAVVASRAMFFYGSESIPWMELYGWQETICNGRVLSPLVVFASDSPESLASDMTDLLGFLSMSFLVAYRMEYATFGPRSLAHVLRVFGEKIATDPRDKVFALVGMAAESADIRLKSLIHYSRPVEDVLLDLANYLLDTEQALGVFDLGGLRQGDRIPGLPSWAVDWSAIRVVASLNPIFSSSEIRYHASGRKPSRVRRGGSRREIVVGGQRVDQIARLAPSPGAWPLSGPLALFMANYPSQALSLAQQHVPDPYPHWRGGQPLEEAVWRTLIGDKTSSARPAPASCGNSVRTLMEFLRDLGDRFGVDRLLSSMSSMSPEEIQRDLGVTPEQQQEVQRAYKEFEEIDFLFDIGKGASTFIFCVTENGYIGMVPQVSEVGDDICLVYGVDVPCILRFAGENDEITKTRKYQLVGDAYIHGIMDGEALSCGKESDFILE